ncbi:toll-like receptor 6 [Mercenaria mercenaria]|uniref:toll-like receptor 6 n=1 Tax=Mercenaria mercenaria TaxID=6596 RepID=UPI00234F7F08|nr:toll-like receptor 6 [Mercenaria mercenaria]
MGTMNINTSVLVVSITLILLVCASTANEVCKIKEQKLTCQYDIPNKIPPGLTEVCVENHKDIDLTRNSFSDPSWKSILTLEIYQNKEKTNSIFVHDTAFIELDSLNVLGIHTHGFSMGAIRGSHILRGLENITKLDFSGCVNLDSDFVRSSLMQDGKFTKLRTLNLNEVNTNFGSKFIKFSQQFTNMIINKRIENLNFRKTMIAFQPFNQKTYSQLLHLDLSEISYSLLSKPDDVLFPLQRFLKNLKSLNISRIFPLFWRGENLRFSNIHCTDCTEVHRLLALNLFYIENIYANDILSDIEIPVEVINSTFNLTCRMNLRVLEFRGNNVRRIQGTTIHWPDPNFLRYLDLTDNKLRFLSPNFSRGLSNLKTVLLGENQLSEMSSPELIDLIANCVSLEKLVLDRNGFSYLAESIFLHNKLLTYLSLKGNLLRQVTFATKHLKHLQYLDLANNLIHILDEQSMNRLNVLMRFQTNFCIKLETNPLECSCKSASFVEWMNKHLVYKLDHGAALNCTLEGNVVNINDKTVAKTKFMCVKTLVYASISFTAVVVIAISTVLFITVSRFLKRRRTTDQVETFLRNYRGNQVKEKFVCFLSYSNTDSDVAIEHIYKNLNETFKEITGLESDTVCIDERHFRAGAEIVAEIMRCVSDSSVIAFVVSRSFCQSNWCCLEIKEAYEQHKPIVLIFCEEVDENEMSAHLKQMFQRYTRAKLVKQGEDVNVQPGGWEGLCESIILLASRQYAENKTQ